MLIIPNMLYCSVFSALIPFPKQSPFARSLRIISKLEALFDAIELLAKNCTNFTQKRTEITVIMLSIPE